LPSVPHDLGRGFVLSQAGHDVLRSGREALRRGVPLIERPFKGFDRRLGFRALLLSARLFKPSFEILVRSPCKSDAALSLATLVIKRAQRGFFLLCLVPHPFELSLEGREFLLRIVRVDDK
jgi:hypothetical protein